MENKLERTTCTVCPECCSATTHILYYNDKVDAYVSQCVSCGHAINLDEEEGKHIKKK